MYSIYSCVVLCVFFGKIYVLFIGDAGSPFSKFESIKTYQ
jgi:hypothetical protein